MIRYFFFLFLFFSLSAFAQITETLTPLTYNTTLYHQTKKYIHKNRYFIDKGNIVVSPTPLSLPFLDEFSSNKQRSYENLIGSIYDSIELAIGPCINAEGFESEVQYYSSTVTYFYSYDTLNDKLDSVAKPSIPFTAYNNSFSGCFSSPPVIENYYPLGYTYNFDTATGAIIDSSLRTADTLELAVAKIYLANAEPGIYWLDNYAWINQSMPTFPPTIGVATFDGLNEFGCPYDKSSPSVYGDADVLTSVPFDLSGIIATDTTVYLSFFYEPKGFGDFPNTNDSLILEAKNQYTGNWDQLWSTPGFSTFTEANDNQFRQVMVNIPTTSPPNVNFFYNQFQFRFRNKANLTGNVDHWHIDYVKLDKNRNRTDTIINDIAVMYPLGTILKNFTQMPADQFSQSDLSDTLNVTVRNNNFQFNTPATNFNFEADEQITSNNLLNTPVQSFIAYEYFTVGVNPASDFILPSGLSTDSFVIKTKCNIQQLDAVPGNNTAENTLIFSNTMAYDDGSAERAYGVEGLGLKKFAMKYELNQPDTLAGFQIHFSNIDANINNLIFNYYVWDNLVMNDLSFVDQPLYSLENQKPLCIDSMNGFATYVLDTPLILPGPIYFGWAQSDDRNLQIGYDLNSVKGRPHMYRFFNGVWAPSGISTQGSPMMRLILDGDFKGSPTISVNELDGDEQLQLFPNPTKGRFYLKSNLAIEGSQISVYNLSGNKVMETIYSSYGVDVKELSKGLYIVDVKNNAKEQKFKLKLIVE